MNIYNFEADYQRRGILPRPQLPALPPRRRGGESLEDPENRVAWRLRADDALPIIDSHCHLDMLFRDERVRGQRSFRRYQADHGFPTPAGFAGAISNWCWPTLMDTAEGILAGDNRLWGTFGCHPHWVAEYDLRLHARIADSISAFPPAVAWGEMGLDYARRHSFRPDRQRQKEVFRSQLRTASRMGLPVVIHCREAEADVFKILKTFLRRDHDIHYHCVTVGPEVLSPVIQRFPRARFGFTNLIYNDDARGRAAQATARALPLDRILAETDAPFHPPPSWKSDPESRCNPKRRAVSHPGMAGEVLKKIAEVKDLPYSEVARQVYQNTCQLYRL